jgi:aminopeptidase N
VVHRDDVTNLARFLPVAVEKIAKSNRALAGVRKKFQKGLHAACREMAGSRSLSAAVAISLLSAALGLGTPSEAGSQPSASRIPPAPVMKPSTPASTVLAASNRASADPNLDYDALSYQISIRIAPPPDDGSLRGTVMLRARAIDDLQSIALDLGTSLDVDSAWCEGQSCAVSRPSPERVRLDLPRVFLADSSFQVGIRYAGTPGPMCFGLSFYSSHGMGGSEFPVVSTMSEPFCSHHWWPCNDTFHDKATVSLTVDSPLGYKVASNGNKMSEITVGDRLLTTWATRYPIPPYLVAFAASDYVEMVDSFETADGGVIPLVVYSYPEDAAAGATHLQTMKRALAAFEPDSVFGPYPFRDETIGVEKLGLVEFPAGGLAMENQTLIFVGEPIFRYPSGYTVTIAHEIAHMWWGDAVTTDGTDDMWLNEGFASYAEALFVAAYDTSGYESGYNRQMRYHRRAIPDVTEETVVKPNDTFGWAVYNKGAYILHMLRGALGERDFFRCLHEYYRRYRFDNATTADFIQTVEETTVPPRDLSWFFIPWLYGTGSPNISWDWQVTDGPTGDLQVSLRIEQTQGSIRYPKGTPDQILDPPTAFAFPIEIRMYGEQDGEEIASRVFVDTRVKTVTIGSLPFRPTRVALDPDEWILGEIGDPAARFTADDVKVWPNPSQGSFRILLFAGSPGNTLQVIDASGRLVRTLAPVAGGYQTLPWDGKDEAGRTAPSGVYMIRMSGSGGTRTTRAILLH